MPLIAFFAAAAGLFIIYRGLRRAFAPGVALLCTLLCVAGTSLYSAIIAAHSVDVVAFALVAALVFETARLRPPVVTIAAWMAAAALPVIARSLQGGDSQSLFGADGGFFSLTPVTYVALLGTLASLRHNPFWAAAALALLVLWSVTGAHLTAALALLAPGLALVIDWLRRRPLVAVTPLLTVAVLWNYWLMVQYTAGMIPKDAPVSFAAMVRQQADVHTRPPYLYPFAFPANVLYSWKEGVPVHRYDVLSVEPRREEFDLVIDRGSERFLLTGWGPPGTNDAGPFRWIDAPRATLTFPLRPSSRDMAVEVLATARGGGPSTTSELTFELNGSVIGRAHVSPVAATEARLPIAASLGGRVLRAGYNRLSIVTSGSHRIAIHRVRIGPAS